MKLFDPPCRNTEICPSWKSCLECEWRVCVSSTDALVIIIIIIIIIIKNECHSNIIVDKLQDDLDTNKNSNNYVLQHSRRSGMDHTVLPAITPMPAFTS